MGGPRNGADDRVPDDGAPIPVALDLERETLAQLPSVNSMDKPCRACGEKHMWRMTDAWIADEWRDHMVDAA